MYAHNMGKCLAGDNGGMDMPSFFAASSSYSGNFEIPSFNSLKNMAKGFCRRSLSLLKKFSQMYYRFIVLDQL